MTSRIQASILLCLMMASTGMAQTMTFGGGKDNLDRRESTWISFFDQANGRFIGGLSINYVSVRRIAF